MEEPALLLEMMRTRASVLMGLKETTAKQASDQLTV